MSYWYLGSPYSKYPGGIDEAFRLVCEQAGHLLRYGIQVYSPIAHCHPIAHYAKIDPHDHKIWLPANALMMAGARGLIVLKLETWESSYGLNFERREFENWGKPIIFTELWEIPEGAKS
jgi:hypothetical protein